METSVEIATVVVVVVVCDVNKAMLLCDEEARVVELDRVVVESIKRKSLLFILHKNELKDKKFL